MGCKFKANELSKGKLALTVLDKDLNGAAIKSGMQFDFYETVNGNLGYIKKWYFYPPYYRFNDTS